MLLLLWLLVKSNTKPDLVYVERGTLIARLTESEKFFLLSDGTRCPFPLEPFGNLCPCVSLSVVVPAFNEEKRIHLFLDPCLSYLVKREENEKGFSFEIIVVLDGW